MPIRSTVSGLRRVVPHRQHLPELVAEDRRGAAEAVDDRRLELALDEGECLGLIAGRGELDVEELKRRLDVGGRARTLDAVRRQRDERRGRGDLAGRQLRQVDGAVTAGARELDLSGRELRFDVLLRGGERAAA